MPAAWGLNDWHEISAGEWPSLLVGNGLSVSVSPVFSYPSLRSVANLSPEEEAVFQALGTDNFELVLNYLRIAEVVSAQLHGPDAAGAVSQMHDGIRQKLVVTVNNRHVANGDVPPARLDSIQTALRAFKRVWMTSYDLIPYWAIMTATPPGDGFADAFWDGTFDPTNAEPLDQQRTRLWWPHGALHLYRLLDGSTVKRQNAAGMNLLQLLGQPYQGVDTPLFISEGTSAAKLMAIRGSDYLSHAYQELASVNGAVVVYGQQLNPQFEQHLIDAVLETPDRAIAFGVFANSQEEADLQRARVTALFPQANLVFFDSRTHPLAA